jgi:hypothetical protein
MRRRVDIFRHLMTTVLTISLPTTTGLHLPPLLPTLMNQLLQPDATMTTLCISLPPLTPATSMRVSRQVGDNIARPSIDNFEREPGPQPGVLLLPLHSTLLPPKSLGATDATRTLIISLPPLDPPLQCASRQDEDNDYVPARPWLNPDTGVIALRDDLGEEGYDGGPTLYGATMVVDDATYRWDHGRNLWLPVCAQVMVVDVYNHRGCDPGRDFWRSLRHHQVAPAWSKSAPIDESSDDDLPPLGESSDDDQD